MSSTLLRFVGWRSQFHDLLPGMILASIIAVAAVGLRQVEFIAMLSPVVLAMILGVISANAVGLPAGVDLGVAFCGKTLLRLAVMLLGCQITFSNILSFGPMGMAAIVTVVFATLGVTLALGRLFRLDRETSALVAIGTSICGASAIAGLNSVIRSKEENVSYAIGIITIFGSFGIFLYPLLRPIFGLSEVQYGLWAGLSLHEVAQAVAAGFAEGDVSGKTAVTAKLGRVLLLSVVIAGFAQLWLRRDELRRKQAKRPPIMPWFLTGFLILASCNSAGLIPHALQLMVGTVTPALMVLAMAAIGLGTRADRLAALGLRPMVVGGLATLAISAMSLGLAVLIVAN